MTTKALRDAVDEAVAAADFGKPTARKAGHDARWPYVPVIDHRREDLPFGGFTTQIRGKAFATRQEAVVQGNIDNERDALRGRLLDPRHRALREQHGLPREIGDVR